MTTLNLKMKTAIETYMIGASKLVMELKREKKMRKHPSKELAQKLTYNTTIKNSFSFSLMKKRYWKIN